MKKVLVATLFFTCTLFASNGAALFQKCSACHGINGQQPAPGQTKIIKNLSKAEFISALKGYKAGTYGGAMKAVMSAQVATLSEDDIKAIADYLLK